MINVNQITSELARMPDAALKQYATMHKDDPYTMSLAMSESNRRKQMRDGAQAQGGQQPTVVDQELAQMGGQPLPQQLPQGAAQAMPENTGIGTLPQQPMGKAMAEGGIVAFGPGGTVGSNASFVDFLAGIGKTGSDFANADIATQKSLTQAFEAATGGGPKVPVGGIPAASAAVPSTAASVPWQAAEGVVPGMQYLKGLGSAAMKGASKLGIVQLGEHLFGTSDQEKRDLAASDPVYRAELEKQGFLPGSPAASTGTTEASGRSAFPGQGATGTNMPYAASTNKGGIADVADVAAKQKALVASSTAPRAASAPAAPAQSLIGRYEDIKSQLGTADPYATQREAVGQAGVNAKQEALTAIEADNAKFANILKGKEAGLADRAANILKQSDTNTGLAFLNAGLSIMSTPGSLATAIGKGAKVGTESFAAGLDKINAAKEKLAEAQDRFEDLKINREEMSAKEIRAAKAGINDAKVAALGMTLDGMEKAGVRNQAAGLAILHGAVIESTNAATNQAHITAAGIAAAPGLERNKILKATQDDQAKIRTAYGTLQTKVMADLKGDMNYQTADPAKKVEMQNTALRNALQNNPFLAKYTGDIGFGGASGKVRELAGVDEAED